MMNALGLTFARPSALWLLLVVPVVALLGFIYGVRRRRLPRVALALRTLTVALLALGLAEPLIARGGDARNTIFVVDRSLSVSQNNAGPIARWLDDALSSAGSKDRAAIIEFDAKPVLTSPPGPASDLSRDAVEDGDPASRGYTDIESALALARSLPVGGSRRIVLISDGAENLGSALNQVGQAATDGTPIDVVTVPGVTGDDLRVDGATAPASVWIGEPVNVVASVASGAGGAADISFVVDGVEQPAESMVLEPGITTITRNISDLAAGFHALTIRVKPGTSSQANAAADVYAGNNEAPLAVVVRDAPKLLLVAPEGSDPRVKGALQRKGAIVSVVTPDRIPSLADLATFDAVILANVAASDLTIDQVTALREVTRGLGKGLIVIGGLNAYGPGNYAGTVLEDALPVTVKTTDGKERPHVALLLIIDKSGSMTLDRSSQVSKIEMAKEAARLAASSLSDGDQIGVLVFSDAQQWVVPMTTIDGQSTRDTIDAAIAAVTADGGTDILPALQAGFDAIRNSAADVRHVVLLSDGKSRTGTPETYQQTIDDAVSDRTTLSTIAIGQDADTELLQQLAGWGKGRYHFTQKPEDIPRITLQEAQSAVNQSVVRGEFQPIQSLPSPIMEGFDPTMLPPLEGYDYAQAKPRAQVVLTSSRDDPILATWQLGLGRVIAWTADDGADFATPWQTWSRYDDFWASLVRWALPDPENRPVNVDVTRDGQQALVTLTSQGSNGDYVNLSAGHIAVTAPGGALTNDIALYQSGPGEYQFRVQAPAPGAYQIAIDLPGAEPLHEISGFTIPSSPELRPDPNGSALMQAIASRTGGRSLTLDDASSVFDAPGAPGTALRTYRAVWFVPLAAALVLLLVELAIRLAFLDRLRGLRHGR